MARSAILAVRIIGDATSAVKAMDQAAGSAGKFERGLNTAAKYSAVALGAITAAAFDAGASASELEQATGAVASVFGEYADEMNKYGREAADAVGLSQSEYGNMASILGAQLKNMGISVGEAAGQTNDLIGLGSDLAATFGGTTSEAVSALSSLLRGERDPIEKYGVSIKQADIDAQKAAMGLTDLTGEAAKNADLQATLALLTTQTADAQGQFARETDSAAGSAQIAAANFENAKAALGEALLPIMTEASDKLAELARWFQENATWITPLVGAIAGLAASIILINAAYKAFAAVQALQTAAQWASNAAWLASPITWIVIAVIAVIALLIAAIVLVVQNWDTIKEKAVEVWEAVIGWIQSVIDWLSVRVKAAILIAAEIWNRIKETAAAVWQAIITWIQNVIIWVQTRIVQAVIAAATIWHRIRETVQAVFQSVINWIQQAISWVGDRLGSAIQGAVNWFTGFRDTVVGVFQTVIQWVRDAISWISDLASNAIPGWAKDLLGMGSASARMAIEPQLAALATPDYSATMRVTPEASALSALSTSATIPALSATGRAATATYEDKRTNIFNFPNFVGDRTELLEWIEAALAKAQINREGIVTV